MKSLNKIIYRCDYCGCEHESKDWMNLHEECCAFNPKNQPCSRCANMILGIGCMRGMNIEKVGGKILCIFYKKGTPSPPIFTNQFINGNFPEGDGNPDD